MFFGRYEIQVLDSFENLHLRRRPGGRHLRPVPAAGQRLPPAGPVADLRHHLHRAAVRADGSLESPAYVTMLHNGVLVHNHTPLIGAMAYRAVGKYTPHGPKGPILLQDHGNPVRFRNIWVRELNEPDQPSSSSGARVVA